MEGKTGCGKGDEILIERGIPIPELPVQGRWVKIIAEMEPGSSFLTTDEEGHSFQKAARKVGCKVIVRKWGDDKAKPCRVWMIEKGRKAPECDQGTKIMKEGGPA